MTTMTPEEAKSFLWGGVRARPRKKIERAPVSDQTYLKPPGSCGTKWGKELGVSICISARISLLTYDLLLTTLLTAFYVPGEHLHLGLRGLLHLHPRRLRAGTS